MIRLSSRSLPSIKPGLSYESYDRSRCSKVLTPMGIHIAPLISNRCRSQQPRSIPWDPGINRQSSLDPLAPNELAGWSLHPALCRWRSRIHITSRPEVRAHATREQLSQNIEVRDTRPTTILAFATSIEQGIPPTTAKCVSVTGCCCRQCIICERKK